MIGVSFADQNTSKITDTEYQQYLEISPDFRMAEDELNSIYKELMSILPPSEKEKLKRSQREWLKMREEEAFKVAPKGSPDYIDSLVKITNDRVAELKAILLSLNQNPGSSQREISSSQIGKVEEVQQASQPVSAITDQNVQQKQTVQNTQPSKLKRVLAYIILIYVLIAGFISLRIVRPPFINWYKSSIFIISGKNPIDILLREIGYRILFELFVFAISCLVGSLGLWILALRKKNTNETGTT